MVHVMDERAADKGSGNVANRADHSSHRLTTRKPWTASCRVVRSGTHAARVGQYLADCNETGKCDCESKTQNPVQSNSETKRADGGKHCFPRQRIMIQPASRAIEFNRQGDARRNT